MVFELSEIRSGLVIPDPDFFPSRILAGVKKAPDPQHCAEPMSEIYMQLLKHKNQKF